MLFMIMLPLLIKNAMNKVSCVMTTYRRFQCVERSIAMFLEQDYDNTELIIYNTDIENPLALDETFNGLENKIKVINNNIDFETKEYYNNTGSIRRDAKHFATGDLYITWDDDDIFFPWNIRQGVAGLVESKKSSWKPKFSFMKHRGHEPELAFNYMEASIVTKLEKINQYGFKNKTGPEHLGWFEELQKTHDMEESDFAIPAYCFYWSDPEDVGGHKQSNLNEFVREDNFQRHKIYTTDYAKRKFTRKSLSDYKELFAPFLPILENFKEAKPERFHNYILPNIDKLR